MMLSAFSAHEVGHAIPAYQRGGTVTRMSILADDRGAQTHVEGLDAKESILVALGGYAAELLLVPDVADVWRSLRDYEEAFRYAFVVAKEEEHAAIPGATREPSGPAAVERLAQISDEDRRAAIERLVSRRGIRAAELVHEAEVEVHELLGANRVFLRFVAARLEEYGQHFDGDACAALLAEGAERQRIDDRRYGVGRRQA